MEKRALRHDGAFKPTKARERSVMLPILGLVTLVFTGAFVSAFVLTSSNIQTLSVQDATLRRQIELLRTQVLSMKQDMKDVSEVFNVEETTENVQRESVDERSSGGKRQIQAVSFIEAVLKAQESVFERYCHDHNATCPAGPAGNKGVPGENGTDGVVTGNITSGVVGPPGDKGVQGEPGIQGLKGRVGDKGNTGDPGNTGPPGIQGSQGAQGDNGTKGALGDPGDKGIQGDRGLKGDIGDGGIPGIDGYIGIQGDPGVNGTRGRQGIAGDAGPPGPKGKPSSLWTDPQCQCLVCGFDL